MTIEEKKQNIGAVPADGGDAAVNQRAVPRLSDTALVILAAAANREGGSLLPVPAGMKARGSAPNAVLFHLSQIGLAEEVPVKVEAESWRREEKVGLLGMRITAAGLAAIGIDAKDDGDGAKEPGRAAGGEAEPVSGAPDRNAGAESVATPGDEAGRSSRFTDRGLERIAADDLEADDEDGTDVVGGVGEAASARRRTKQDQIVELLSREEGASIEALMTATDWLPHTVRAALSGLRKKGYDIQRHKDAKGVTVYRIALPTDGDGDPGTGGEAR